MKNLLKWIAALLLPTLILSACAPASTQIAATQETIPATDAPVETEDPGVTLDFVNNSDSSIDLYWVNGNGDEESFGSVGVGETLEYISYSGSIWRLRDANGNLVSEYTVTEEPQQTLTITADMVAVNLPYERSTVDRPDDTPGMYQVHVLYVLPAGATDQNRDLDGKFDTSVQAANDWFYPVSGGSRVRFDTYQGRLDITFVQLAMTSDEIYQASVDQYGGAYWIRDIIEAELVNLGIFQPGKIYLALTEIDKHPSTCDDAPHPPDLMGRMAGFYPSAVVEAGWNCFDFNGGGNFGAGSTYADLAIFHEIFHTLGFSPSCGMNPAAPDNHSHTGDFNTDLMWAPGPNTPADIYWDTDNMELDPGNDDYFHISIPNCPDLANSAFLDPLPASPETPVGWPSDWMLP